MHANGRVYQVQDEHRNYTHGEDWHEYTAYLICDCGHCVDEWDSYTETYNGIQWLDKKTAGEALAEVQEAVKNGEAAEWFSAKACFVCKRPVPGA